MIDWRLGKPFYSPTHLRALVAIRDGCRTKEEIGAAIHRKNMAMSNILNYLQKRGHIYYAHAAYEWRLCEDWPTTVASIKKRLEWLMGQYLNSIDDLMEATPYGQG